MDIFMPIIVYRITQFFLKKVFLNEKFCFKTQFQFISRNRVLNSIWVIINYNWFYNLTQI